MNLKRPALVLIVLCLAALASSGCSRKSRLARLARKADADFAAERYDAAEIEYRSYLQHGLDAGALGHLGLIYKHQGRTTTAFQCLKKSDDLDPKNPEIKAALAAAFLGLGDPKDAFHAAQNALALQPTNRDALLLLSETVQSPEEAETARASLRALPRQLDSIPEFHVALANLALKLRDATNAESELRAALSRDPKSADAHYRLGQIYFQAGNLTQATNELRSAVSFADWRSPIRLAAVDYDLQTMGSAAAHREMDEIISNAPDFIPARAALMKLDFAEKHFDDCKKDIAAVLEKDADNFDAAVELGLVDLAQSDQDAALKQFSTLEARRPHAPVVKYYLGVASMEKNEPDKARRYLSQAAELNTNYAEPVLLLAELDIRSKNIPAAIQRLTHFIRQETNSVEPRLLLAQAYSAHQEPDRALAIYRELSELQPKNPRMPYLMGIASVLNRDFAGAGKAFARALQLDDKFQPALTRLVEVDVAERHYDEAQQLVQRHIDQDSKNGGLWLLLAQVYQAQKMDAQAEDALNKAISLDPTLSPAYVTLAQLYVGDHKEQQALDKLNSLVARTNDVPALMALGVIQQQLTNYQAAADCYEKLLTVNKNFVPALNNLAYLYGEKLGQLDKALQDAQKANELSPYNAFCADTLGWVLFKRGEFTRALPFLREGAEGEPGAAENQFHLGMDYYMLGAEAPARLALQNAVSSLANFPEKDQARQSLAVLSADPNSTDPQTAPFLQQALQRDSRDPIAAARLAEIEERAGDFDKAAQLCQQSLKSNPKNAAMMARLAALDADHLQHPDAALKLARDAHDLDGDDPVACATLGRLSYERGQLEYALSLLQKAAANDQAPPRVFSDLARAEYAAGKIEEAKSAAQTAVTKLGSADSQDQLFLTLVSAAASSAAAKAAFPQAQAALKQDPHDLPALMVCGAAVQADGDFKGAISYFETALTAFPQFPPALWQSAVLWAGPLADDDKAFAFAEKARPFFPGDPQLAKILGRGAYRHGDYARSSQVLQEVSGHAADGEMLYYLGMDYYKLQRRGDSKVALEKALALSIPSSLADDAKRTLTELK